MTLEPNFVPPDKAISKAETAKRNELIAWFGGVVDNSVVGFLVSGSMAYGANYSVKPSSDIDMQLLVTPDTVTNLSTLGLFNGLELEKAVTGYLEQIYGQFSLVFTKDGVSMECHFWDSQAFMDTITYKAVETKRLRSDVTVASTDHGFSFARIESVVDYYGEMVKDYPVGILPSYREVDGTLYLCRPVTNILGLPRIEKTNPELDAAMESTWYETITRLGTIAKDNRLDLNIYNIENALPGKNKMRPDILATIRQRTRDELDSIALNYTG